MEVDYWKSELEVSELKTMYVYMKRLTARVECQGRSSGGTEGNEGCPETQGPRNNSAQGNGCLRKRKQELTLLS